MTRGPNGTFTYSGSSLQIIKWLAEKFKFKLSVIPINQTLANKLGTHAAAFYQLQNDQDINGIVPSFFLSMDRVERFDFTSFIWAEGFRLVLPRPGEESRLFAFIRPFQPWVWLSIFVSVLVIVGAMKIFDWIYFRHDLNNFIDTSADTKHNPQDGDVKENSVPKRNFISTSNHVIYVINTLTNQGGREAFSRHSFRILAGFWVLCAMVLVNSYTGIVTSSLTTPKLKPSIESLEELAASTEIGIVVRSDTPIGAQILEATSGIYKVLGDQVRLHPDRIFVDPFKLNAKLETGQFAYAYMNTFTIAFVSSHYKKEGTCRFKVSKPLPILTGFYSLLHKKGTWYTKTIRRGLMDLWESGLVKFWVNNLPTLPKADACFVDSKRGVSRPVAIKLTDLTSAFLILGIGIGLAILVFMLELIYWKLLAMQKKLAIVEI
ncbi:ionotropic receptor 93a-like [Daphnia pulex]|uniref:ionotropic receptor 93a-like n=1 Tax=Daphnia pulex TaxID=6669 RepID=UPI001EDF7877|nr:ionotropic receptor 93a-like [Daphnia pulex]